MNKINRIASLVIFSVVASTSLYAQRADDEMEREVIMLREYNPVLDDAEKINIEPKILVFDKERQSPIFIEKAPYMNLTSKKIGYILPGVSNTKVNFDNQIGYLGFGAGNYGNIIGNGGIRTKAGQNGLFNLWGRYLGSNGDVNYAKYDILKLLSDKSRAKYQDIDLHAEYQLENDFNIFTAGIEFQSLGYNYYGAPVGFESFDSDFPQTQEEKENLLKWFDQSTMQRVTFLDFYANLFSKSATNSVDFIYNGGIHFKSFNTSKGYLPSISGGPKGGIASANFGLAKAVLEGSIGADINAKYQYFSDRDKYKPAESNYYSNYFNFGFTPYYIYEDLNWDLKVGANLNYVNYNSSNKILLTPNVNFKLKFNDVNTFYFDLLGGIKDNTFDESIAENRYINLYSNVEYSKTPFDGKLGFKIGSLEGVEIDIFGGYKLEKNAHYYLATNSFVNTDFPSEYHQNSLAWGNLGLVQYLKTLDTGSFGVQAVTSIIPYTKLLVRGTGYFYNVSGESEHAYNRPNFETFINACITPIDDLSIDIAYILQTGRKGIFQKYSFNQNNQEINKSKYQVYDMKNINELDISAEYRIIKNLSIFAKVNNLLNAKYELQTGYTLQGINLHGGFNLKF